MQIITFLYFNFLKIHSFFHKSWKLQTFFSGNKQMLAAQRRQFRVCYLFSPCRQIKLCYGFNNCLLLHTMPSSEGHLKGICFTLTFNFQHSCHVASRSSWRSDLSVRDSISRWAGTFIETWTSSLCCTNYERCITSIYKGICNTKKKNILGWLLLDFLVQFVFYRQYLGCLHILEEQNVNVLLLECWQKRTS